MRYLSQWRTEATLLVVLLLLAGCAHYTNYRVGRQAKKYLAQRPDISDELREHVVNGEIVLGMYPDEAVAAGGPFTYRMYPALEAALGQGYMFGSGNIRHYFGFAKYPDRIPRRPTDIAFRQRHHPDDSFIQFSFHNRTQFDSRKPVWFSVVFGDGKATAIFRNDWGFYPAWERMAIQMDREWQEMAIQEISYLYSPEGSVGSNPEQEIPFLMCLLRHENNATRRRVAAALGKIGEPAVPALVEALDDQRYVVRQHACAALAYMRSGAQDAVPDLVTLLNSENNLDRRDAASVLGRIGRGAKVAVPVLMELLYSDDVRVRRAAADALGNIGPGAANAVPALTEALSRSDEYLRVHRAARIAIIRILGSLEAAGRYEEERESPEQTNGDG